jgi:glycosyltransferase involved in cell wall biosynthesis
MTDPSTIVLVFHDLGLGGIQKKIVDLISYLHQYKPHTTIIICVRSPHGIFRKQIPSYVKVYSPPIRFSRLDTVIFTSWLTIMLVQIKPRLVLAYLDLGAIPAIISSKLLFWIKCPVVISEDTYTSKYLATKRYPQIKRFLIKHLYPHSQTIMVPTKIQQIDLGHIIQPKSPHLINISPNWLPLEYTQPIPTTKKNIDILYVGRLDPGKNLIEFLDIIKLVQSTISHLNVVIVGDGPDLKLLKSYSQKNKIYVSFMPATLNTKNIYLRAKIYLIPSRYEGFPLTILEAIACNCLPMAYHLDEICTFFGKSSIFVYNNPQQAANKIIHFLTDPSPYQTILKKIQIKVFADQPRLIKQYSKNLTNFPRNLKP